MNHKANSLAVLCLVLAGNLVQADEPGKVTSQSSYLSVNGQTYGFLGLCNLEIDEKPAAAFGLFQPPGSKPRYTFLILFKPDPKGQRASGAGGNGSSSNSSDGTTACDLALWVSASGRRIEFDYKLEADAKSVSTERLKIGGQEYGKEGPRVFLVDLADEKATPHPIKVIPNAVPSFADEDAWGKQILKARAELIEKSPDVKKFFAEAK